MELFDVMWKHSDGNVLFSGRVIVSASDVTRARQMVADWLGEDAYRPSIDIHPVVGPMLEIRRNENFLEPSDAALPRLRQGHPAMVYEMAARANVIATNEKTAWDRFAKCTKSGKADGQYCKLFKRAIIDTEEIGGMSQYELNMLNREFRFVQGGAVRSR